jgi:hypothetical protein
MLKPNAQVIALAVTLATALDIVQAIALAGGRAKAPTKDAAVTMDFVFPVIAPRVALVIYVLLTIVIVCSSSLSSSYSSRCCSSHSYI